MSENRLSFCLQVLKAVLLSVIVALIGVFSFALLLRFVQASDVARKIVVAVLKALCVTFGGFFAVKEEKGWIKGGIAGGVSMLVTRLIFAAFCGSFAFSAWVLLDVLLGVITGAIVGAIAVNWKRG